MQLKTQKGYDFFEVSSSFQKAIRRGDENQALYWAVELYLSNYDEYAWKRMRIMVSEDIGLAEPLIPANISALYQCYNEQKKKAGKKREERIFYIHAVILLVRAKKSRLVDYSLLTYFRSHETTEMDIPDYALDQHTLKGKAKKRGADHFFDVGAHIENSGKVEGEAEIKKRARAAKDLPPVKFQERAKSKGNGSELFD